MPSFPVQFNITMIRIDAAVVGLFYPFNSFRDSDLQPWLEAVSSLRGHVWVCAVRTWACWERRQKPESNFHESFQ